MDLIVSVERRMHTIRDQYDSDTWWRRAIVNDQGRVYHVRLSLGGRDAYLPMPDVVGVTRFGWWVLRMLARFGQLGGLLDLARNEDNRRSMTYEEAQEVAHAWAEHLRSGGFEVDLKVCRDVKPKTKRIKRAG